MSKFTPTCLGFDAFRILCFPSFLVMILVMIQHPLSGSFSWSIGLRSNRTKCKCYTVCITSDERFLNLSILGTGDLRFLWHLHFWFRFRDSELASLAYQRFLLMMPLYYIFSCYSSTLFLQVHKRRLYASPSPTLSPCHI